MLSDEEMTSRLGVRGVSKNSTPEARVRPARSKIVPDEIIGTQFNDLKIVSMYRNHHQVWRAICRCVCGKLRDTGYHDLRASKVTSCGCRRHKGRFALCHPDRPYHDNDLCDACSTRKRAFKLTVEQTIEIAQNGKCAVCGSKEKIRVDHDHASGLIRGILCNEHNLGVGKFKDNPEHLRIAATYLEEFRAKVPASDNP